MNYISGIPPGVRPVPSSEITNNDVLCGRGGNINCHPGNERFRQFVDRKRRLYLTARFKREKRLIACSIVDEIHALCPRGRFLNKIQAPGSKRGRKKAQDPGWYEIDIDKAREKVSQALRENATEIRKVMQGEKARKETGQGQHDDDDYDDQVAHPGDQVDNQGENYVTQLDQAHDDSDAHSWIPYFPEISYSNSWNSFKTMASSVSSAGLAFIPFTGSGSNLSIDNSHNKLVYFQDEVAPMQTEREKRGSHGQNMEHSVKPCDMKTTRTNGLVNPITQHNPQIMQHQPKVKYHLGPNKPDHPSMPPPPPQPKRQLMRDWVPDPRSKASSAVVSPDDLICHEHLKQSWEHDMGVDSMSYDDDVAMENEKVCSKQRAEFDFPS